MFIKIKKKKKSNVAISVFFFNILFRYLDVSKLPNS